MFNGQRDRWLRPEVRVWEVGPQNHYAGARSFFPQ